MKLVGKLPLCLIYTCYKLAYAFANITEDVLLIIVDSAEEFCIVAQLLTFSGYPAIPSSYTKRNEESLIKLYV
jgi:hypothetical protein